MGVKLDLACGQRPQDGFEGVDVVNGPGVEHVVDLWRFPWPFAPGSVSEVFCAHFCEHIPLAFWNPDARTRTVCPEESGSKDLFFAFWDEVWRILEPGGRAVVIVPSGRSSRHLQDPTHRRPMCENTWMYLNRATRVDSLVSHYRVDCDFEVASRERQLHPNLEGDDEEMKRYAEVHLWDAVVDMRVVLVKR